MAMGLGGYLIAKAKIRPVFAFLTAFLSSPFLLSLILYLLFNLLPKLPAIFYIFFLLLPSVYIFSLKTPVKFFSKIRTYHFSLFFKLLSGVLLFMLLICGLRVFFWPINWDDQIYYIEQSYALGQAKTMREFHNWGKFDNGILRYTYNPAIRPGLPLVYASASLFSTRLSTVVVWSQFMSWYFIVILVVSVFYAGKQFSTKDWAERGLISNLLIFSTYQFINHSVQGFKELPILCLVMLALQFISGNRSGYTKTQIGLLGMLLGLASYINISGSLLALIMLLIYFLINDERVIKKIKVIIMALLLISIFSGMEFVYAFTWAVTGGTKNISVSQIIKQVVTASEEPVVPINSYKNAEFNSYKIFNVVDSYTKGKLQGFFQINFYGLVFPLFALLLVLKFNNIISGRHSRIWLVFIVLYYLLLIDLFNLNPNGFSYVTTVSQKYTVLITPFVAIMIGKYWSDIKEYLNRMSIHLFGIISGFSLILVLLILKPNVPLISRLVTMIIPQLNSRAYYNQVISSGINAFVILMLALGLILSVIYIKYHKDADKFWKANYLSSFSLLLVFFIFPVLFFFNSNYGLDKTLFESFSSNQTKLGFIRGWENIYFPLIVINSLPDKSTILFSDQPYQLMALHLKFPARQIVEMNNNGTLPLETADITTTVKQKRINYIVVNTGRYKLPSQQLIFGNAERSIYKTEFAN